MDFLFSFYLLIELLKRATNYIQTRCSKLEKLDIYEHKKLHLEIYRYFMFVIFFSIL